MKKIIILISFIFLYFSSYAKTGYEYYNDAYDLYLVNDYKGALKELKNAIKLLPEFEKAYNLAGLCHIALKQPDHAIYMYKRAVYINPKYDEAYYNMAVAYEIKDSKNTKLPEQFYKKAIELRNDLHVFVRASLNLARIYRVQKKFDDAILLLREAIKIEPDFEELYNEAGLVYFDSELYDEAINFFNKALEKKHKYPEASTNLAIAYQKKGQLAKAISQLEDTIAKDENFAGAHYNYGNALIYNGFYDKAIAHLKKAIELDPKFAEAYYSLGKAYAHKNLFDEAENAYKKALELRKNYTLAKRALEEVKKQKKEFVGHITFAKKKTGEEGEEVTEEEEAKPKKKSEFAEDVEDLRPKEDKPKKAEGEEGEEGEGEGTEK